jgi:hypothetical protein
MAVQAHPDGGLPAPPVGEHLRGHCQVNLDHDLLCQSEHKMLWLYSLDGRHFVFSLAK